MDWDTTGTLIGIATITPVRTGAVPDSWEVRVGDGERLTPATVSSGLGDERAVGAGDREL